jgi:hypothetical protein
LKLGVTAADVGYLVEEVYRGKSVLSGVSTRLALVRWRKPVGSIIELGVEGQKSSKVQLWELVCMTKEEATRHEKEVLKGGKQPEGLYDRETVALVESRIQEEIGYERFR